MTDQHCNAFAAVRMYADIGRPSIAPGSCCGPCCCRCSTPSAERMLMGNSITTSCSGGLWVNMDDVVWVDGVQQEPGPAWRGPSPRHSLTRCCARRASRSCCRRSTSRWTGRSGGVGEPEELSEEGRAGGAAAGGPGNPTVDFHKEKRTNETHQSTTDPDARLARKGKGKEAAELRRARADGEPQRAGGECAADPGHRHRRAGSGRGDGGRHSGPEAGDGGCRQEYDAEAMVQQLRERKATPHVAQNQERRRSAIDSRTTRHPGYQISQRARKKVEESFSRVAYRGLERVGWIFTFTAAAFNLVRTHLVIGAGPPRSGPRGRLRRSVSKGLKRAGKGKRQGPKGPIARFTTNRTAQRKFPQDKRY